MPSIPVDRIQPLMVLAENVCDRSGRLLATKGMILTDQHLLVFKTWGIREVAILDEQLPREATDTDAENTVEDTRIAEIEEMLKPRFRLNDLQHPLINQLLQLAVRAREPLS